MTRLRVDNVSQIPGQIQGYDTRLTQQTGASLRWIACRAAGVYEGLIVEVQDRIRIAVVPIGSGLGVIDGFSEAVAAIVAHLGFDTFVTEQSDAAGIAEGLERGAGILMLADDERFVALNSRRRQVAENSQATALGFVAALELMKGGLGGESVLVLGCGPVGVAATKGLLERGASVALCDISRDRAREALEEFSHEPSERVWIEDTPEAALTRYDLIFDATDTGDFIEPRHLTPKAMVAAPGLPCGLTPGAVAGNRDRVLHDALEIGTATMAIQAAATLAGIAEAGTADER